MAEETLREAMKRLTEYELGTPGGYAVRQLEEAIESLRKLTGGPSSGVLKFDALVKVRKDPDRRDFHKWGVWCVGCGQSKTMAIYWASHEDAMASALRHIKARHVR